MSLQLAGDVRSDGEGHVDAAALQGKLHGIDVLKCLDGHIRATAGVRILGVRGQFEDGFSGEGLDLVGPGEEVISVRARLEDHVAPFAKHRRQVCGRALGVGFEGGSLGCEADDTGRGVGQRVVFLNRVEAVGQGLGVHCRAVGEFRAILDGHRPVVVAHTLHLLDETGRLGAVGLEHEHVFTDACGGESPALLERVKAGQYARLAAGACSLFLRRRMGAATPMPTTKTVHHITSSALIDELLDSDQVWLYSGATARILTEVPMHLPRTVALKSFLCQSVSSPVVGILRFWLSCRRQGRGMTQGGRCIRSWGGRGGPR